jgi:hypothetical protein
VHCAYRRSPKPQIARPELCGATGIAILPTSTTSQPLVGRSSDIPHVLGLFLDEAPNALRHS